MCEQTCADCRGVGYQLVGFTGTMPRFGDSVCPTCDGTGEVHRTGPYRLSSGEWSDGVDRTHAIPSHDFSKANPDRVYVHATWERQAAGHWFPEFDVWQGGTCIEDGLPFAEAVAYADRMARTNQGENNE